MMNSKWIMPYTSASAHWPWEPWGTDKLRTCLELDRTKIILSDSSNLSSCLSHQLDLTRSSILRPWRSLASSPLLEGLWEPAKTSFLRQLGKGFWFPFISHFYFARQSKPNNFFSCHQTLQPALCCTCSGIKLHSDNSPSAVMFGDLYQGRCSANGLFVGGGPHSANCQHKSCKTHWHQALQPKALHGVNIIFSCTCKCNLRMLSGNCTNWVQYKIFLLSKWAGQGAFWVGFSVVWVSKIITSRVMKHQIDLCSCNLLYQQVQSWKLELDSRQSVICEGDGVSCVWSSCYTPF